MKSFGNLILAVLVLSMSLLLVHCGKDDPVPDTLPPTISFTGGTSANVERGQSIDITLNVTAQGGIASVTANGTAVSGVTPGASTQTLTYTFSAANDEALGPKEIQFVVTDQKNKTAQATFTATVIGSIIQVTSDIVTNTTWIEGNIYVLNNTIKVENATLTIERGVTVQAKDDGRPVKDPAKVIVALRVEPTGRIQASGEAGKPIVFTVDATTPAPGMWRGLIIKGDPLATDHNAGTLRYVRIEFGGGDEDAPTADKGSLTFINVGKSTTVEYVQVFRSLGEGFRIEGSTMALKYCISTENIKSNLMTRHTGSVPNVIHTNLYLQNFLSQNASIDKDSRDILMSNPPTGANGNTLTASNITLLGPGRNFTASGGGPSTADAMRSESRNGRILIYNSIVAEFPEDGLRFSNNVPESRVEYSYIFQIGGVDPSGIPSLGNSTALRENAVVFADAAYNNDISPSSTTIAGISPSSFVPNAQQNSSYNPTALNDANFTFQPFQYVGAIGSSDWTRGGWAKNANGTIRN